MEGWFGLVGWPTTDSLSTKWSLSAIDQAQVRDEASNHWATPPDCVAMSWAFGLLKAPACGGQAMGQSQQQQKLFILQQRSESSRRMRERKVYLLQ